ncbi:MAG: condensation domain-containing protein, partial [Verrucomicrobiota bacterium]
MINLNQKIAGLSPAKRALLEARLIKKALPENSAKIAAPRNIEVPELSFAQQSLWFLDRLEPNSSFYSIPQAFRISGPVNIEALRKSFETIINRHEVLRTQIIDNGGNPKPRVVESVTFELPLIDLSQFLEHDQHTKTRELINAEAKHPFDLENDLMLRAGLLLLGKHEHILLLTVHHIASDLWSFSVLYRELAALYRAFGEQNSSPLPELKNQYSNFARAQRDFLEGENFGKQLEYWKMRLDGGLPELELPADFPRPKTQSFQGGRKYIRVPLALTVQLKTLSQREGVTPYITLLAAFQTLLHRYSDQTDVIIGSPLGGRSQIETEQLIGYFLNTLVLRTDLSGDPNFREVLQRSRDVVLGAFANQEIPFEKLVDELRVPRNTQRNPIFQSIFQFQPGPLPTLQLHQTKTELLELENGTSKMDLIFTLAENEHGLSGNLEYNTDLFEGETIERMLRQYGRLLEGIVENPEQKISRLNLWSEAERRQVLVDWNQTATDYPLDKC